MSNGQFRAWLFAQGGALRHPTLNIETGRVFSLSPGERAGVRGKKPSANPSAYELVRRHRRDDSAEVPATRSVSVAGRRQPWESAELSLRHVVCRVVGCRLLPPHPGPLPRGEGGTHPALRQLSPAVGLCRIVHCSLLIVHLFICSPFWGRINE